MPFNASVINVMIASPGDVAEERGIIQNVIYKWNHIHAKERQTIVLPRMWELDSNPEMGDRPQAIINRQLLQTCDLLVAVFWTRLGSPTGVAPSGTVEEIQEHLRANRPAMIYFSSRPIPPDSVKPEQYAALKSFQAEMQQKGLICTYKNLEHFSEQFKQHLDKVLYKYFSTNNHATPNVLLATGIDPLRISEASQTLLSLAARGDGRIMRIPMIGGISLTAGSQLLTIDTPRTEAMYDSAIRELMKLDLVAPVGYKNELFRLTEKGYQLADRITPTSTDPPLK